MDKFLREWRQDAVNRHQYETAIFVADKLLALTGTRLCILTQDSADTYLKGMTRTRSILRKYISVPETTVEPNRSSPAAA